MKSKYCRSSPKMVKFCDSLKGTHQFEKDPVQVSVMAVPAPRAIRFCKRKQKPTRIPKDGSENTSAETKDTNPTTSAPSENSPFTKNLSAENATEYRFKIGVKRQTKMLPGNLLTTKSSLVENTMEIPFMGGVKRPGKTVTKSPMKNLSEDDLEIVFSIPPAAYNRPRIIKILDNMTEPREVRIQRILRRIERRTKFKERKSMGHSFKSIVKYCLFKGKLCGPENFTLSYNYEFGNCWTFKGADENGDVAKVSKPNPLFGLTLDLYYDTSNSMEVINKLEGFRIAIHDQQSIPFPQERGIDINLNQQTSIGISKNVKRWLEKPYYTMCEDKDPATYLKNSPNSTQYSYSTAMCNRDCLQKYIWDRCGCTDPALYFSESRFDGPSCDVDNQTEICCLENLFDELKHGINCGCTIPCSHTQYDTTVSQLKWTASEDDYMESLTKWNVARVKIFFDTMDVNVNKIAPKYQVVDIFSNLGGQIGLWLGISLVALYEAGEKLTMLLYKTIKKTRKGSPRKYKS